MDDWGYADSICCSEVKEFEKVKVPAPTVETKGETIKGEDFYQPHIARSRTFNTPGTGQSRVTF